MYLLPCELFTCKNQCVCEALQTNAFADWLTPGFAAGRRDANREVVCEDEVRALTSGSSQTVCLFRSGTSTFTNPYRTPYDPEIQLIHTGWAKADACLNSFLFLFAVCYLGMRCQDYFPAWCTDCESKMGMSSGCPCRKDFQMPHHLHPKVRGVESEGRSEKTLEDKDMQLSFYKRGPTRWGITQSTSHTHTLSGGPIGAKQLLCSRNFNHFGVLFISEGSEEQWVWHW